MGLHQALEAKEGAKIQPENQTLASITFQNYFRLYKKLSGMTGTALTEADEFADIYGLGVLEIPTNVDISRLDEDDEVYRTAQEKYTAIVERIVDCQNRNQPILVGTASIEKSETISALLDDKKFLKGIGIDKPIKHKVLNARYHDAEASIISQAGAPGAVTIATNMAGRGTDIQLGGNLDMQLNPTGWMSRRRRRAASLQKRPSSASLKSWKRSIRWIARPCWMRGGCLCWVLNAMKADVSTISCVVDLVVRAIPGLLQILPVPAR